MNKPKLLLSITIFACLCIFLLTTGREDRRNPQRGNKRKPKPIKKFRDANEFVPPTSAMMKPDEFVNVASTSDSATSTSTETPPNLFPMSVSLLSSLSPSNVLISPYSIASALALVMEGATITDTATEGTVRKELGQILGIDETTVPSFFANLVGSSSKEVQFESANAVFVAPGKLLDSYVATVREDYRAEAMDLPATYGPVNDYVSQKTHGMIEKLQDSSESIDPLTVALLVNAVAFKGSWSTQFDKVATSDRSFYAIGTESSVTSTKTVPFMFADRNFDVVTSSSSMGGATVVRLDYGDDGRSKGALARKETEFSAVFILPPKEEGDDHDISSVDTVLSNLENLPKALLELRPRKVRLLLPRFRLSYGPTSLKESLHDLGVTSAFDKDGQFFQMSNDPMVRLTDVVHAAVVEVTEEGTVAAAATMATMKTRSIPRPSPEIRFDRPFLMVILHNPSMTPVFIGKITDPEPVLS